MPPKKTASAANGDEEDVSCDQFYKIYRRNCTTLETPVSPRIREMYEEYVEEGKLITRIHVWDELGWQGTKAIIDAMMQANYKHTVSIRFWKGKCQDEGARLVSSYVMRFQNCTVLELLDCQISPLGCEFLASAFAPRASMLQMIKLDHNPIGSAGMNILANGLAQNTEVTLLSLTYCEIGPEGAQGLFETIIYQQSKITELCLTGNPLENEGICKIFQGLTCNKALTSVYLSDCQWDDSEEVLAAMKMAMTGNTLLGKYDLKHNSVTDEGVEEICKIVEEAKHISQLTLSEWISGDAMTLLMETLAANKPAKGKKGGKKKKK